MYCPFPFSIYLIDAILSKPLLLSVLTQFHAILLWQVTVSWGFVYSGGFDCKSPVQNKPMPEMEWNAQFIWVGLFSNSVNQSLVFIYLCILFEPPALMLTNGNQMKCAKCFCQKGSHLSTCRGVIYLCNTSCNLFSFTYFIQRCHK